MREFLIGLGLAPEAIDSIMAEHGKLLTASTEKITELTAKVNNLSSENTELKKVDAAALQKQIEDLTAERDTMKETHATEMSAMKFDSALELAVLNAKTIDPVGFKAHLDTSKLKYNEETKTIDGFDDQLAAIKESHKHLFSGTQATGSFQGSLNNTTESVALSGALKEHYE